MGDEKTCRALILLEIFSNSSPFFREMGRKWRSPSSPQQGEGGAQAPDEGAAQPNAGGPRIVRNPQPLYHLALRFAPPSSGPLDHLLPAGEKRERTAGRDAHLPLGGGASDFDELGERKPPNSSKSQVRGGGYVVATEPRPSPGKSEV